MNEIDCTIELMVGSSLAPGKDEVRFIQRIADVRAAGVVVATAGAFEHAMCKVTVVYCCPVGFYRVKRARLLQ